MANSCGGAYWHAYRHSPQLWHRFARYTRSALPKAMRCSIAGNTGQYCSQYRQALQTVITRSPSATSRLKPAPTFGEIGVGAVVGAGFSRLGDLSTMTRGGLPGNASEYGADRHANSGNVSLPQDVPRHDLAGGVDVGSGRAVGHHDARGLIDSEPQVGECDAGPKRIAPEGRGVDPLRPMRLGRRQALCTAIVEHCAIERPRSDRLVE